ncbi:DUF4260 domain-containing protein [Microvirga sp. Mcv34]|uniref:DUF4260 domain-containing protein n=1 Tax=Microvirga sp. Mcv34 TaxID=2926016 RepID=UPI003967BA72
MDTTLTTRREADMPRLLLRLEGLALFVLATAAFAHLGLSWWLYAVLFFVPDLSFAAYTAGPRTGAVFYNALHSTLGPAILAGSGWLSESALCLGLAAIWAAHIGFDRMLGYGLKYPSGFNDTHLGRIGPKSAGA